MESQNWQVIQCYSKITSAIHVKPATVASFIGTFFFEMYDQY